MLNKIWFAFLLIGILYGFARGVYNTFSPTAQVAAIAAGENAENAETKVDENALPPPSDRNLHEMGKGLNAAALSAATVSVEICLKMIGIMALWLGLLAVARDAGMIDALARLMRPMMRWLFPDVPDGHPAQGAILMNISANMLNLDNAATPLGLKAMQELQTLNPDKETATDSMAMFMAINTSSVTIIPFTIIGYRATSGSLNPAEPMFGIIIVTAISTLVAIIVTRLLSKSSRFTIAGGAPLDGLSTDERTGEER